MKVCVVSFKFILCHCSFKWGRFLIFFRAGSAFFALQLLSSHNVNLIGIKTTDLPINNTNQRPKQHYILYFFFFRVFLSISDIFLFHLHFTFSSCSLSWASVSTLSSPTSLHFLLIFLALAPCLTYCLPSPFYMTLSPYALLASSIFYIYIIFFPPLTTTASPQNWSVLWRRWPPCSGRSLWTLPPFCPGRCWVVMGRNCSLKVQVLYTAPFSLTGVFSVESPHSLSRHRDVRVWGEKNNKKNEWSGWASGCVSEWLSLSWLLLHSFVKQVRRLDFALFSNGKLDKHEMRLCSV